MLELFFNHLQIVVASQQNKEFQIWAPGKNFQPEKQDFDEIFRL